MQTVSTWPCMSRQRPPSSSHIQIPCAGMSPARLIVGSLPKIRRPRVGCFSIFLAIVLAYGRTLCHSFVGKASESSETSGNVCKDFKKGLSGQVICDGLAKYPFEWGNADCNGILPLLVVRPSTEEDIALTVRRSTTFGLPLSVRSGGHSYTCDGIKPGSVHLDLRSRVRKQLYHESSGWYAEFETGNTFRDLFRIVDRRRFSIVHGACHAVGVGGFYLHGGLHMNSLTALYGWGNETIVSMRVAPRPASSGKVFCHFSSGILAGIERHLRLALAPLDLNGVGWSPASSHKCHRIRC